MVPCGCILSKFYIKPQPSARVRELLKGCILSKFYIKPQLPDGVVAHGGGCILSKFYIKPQRWVDTGEYVNVVSYRNSTSNHNFQPRCSSCCCVVSYRNSTSNHNFVGSVLIFVVLYLIEILHQTTTVNVGSPGFFCCILSKFYIKPQLIEPSVYF